MRRTLAALAATFVVVAGAAAVVPSPAAEATAPPAPSAVAAPQAPTRTVIGHSVRGRPIRAFYRGDPDATHVLLVLGQMHGDEKAGPATARWLKKHLTPKPGTGIWVIPTMNPDGAARRTRTNAHGVDLNRNWPTSGWSSARRGTRYWGGPRPASEPETQAMIAFLREIAPDYIASIHQPLRGIGRSGRDVRWEKRLSRNLHLPRRHFGVGNPSGTVSPTLTGWYDSTLGRHGVATTIEYGVRTSVRFRTAVAGRGIARAARVR
ncbi:M14 family zinc carboxypeptidase [Pimelobacter simplex]|uniref:M14 family zinc carboxypeptidase n=1 Tax=Nocardioides simplex TaxID=2045 RepID=UPI003AAC3253